jgi:hypothetical protein
MVLYKADINGKVVIPSNENVDVIRKGEVDPTAVNILFAENSYVVMFGDEAFQNFTKLTTIIIPSSVISIGSRAFQNCTNLGKGKPFKLPRTVEILGVGAFSGCFTRPDKTKINNNINGIIAKNPVKETELLPH